MIRRLLVVLAALAIVAILFVPLGKPPVAAAGSPSRVFLPLVQAPSPWVTILSDSFESGALTNWTVDYTAGASPVTWGISQCRSFSGNSSAWILGSTHPGCGSTYQPNMDAWMVYGPFNLQGARAADVSFSYWTNAESNVDRLAIGVSTDGYNFDGRSTSGSSNGWHQGIADLNHPSSTAPSALGSSSVWIAFVFSSDSANNAVEGAYVDDVVLQKCSEASCPGAVSTANMLSAVSALSQTSPIRMSDWSGSLPNRGR